MSIKLNKNQLEQLQNIVYYGPVASGDLIGKSLRDELSQLGYVAYLLGCNKPRSRDGIRIGGWVATDSGREAYFKATGKGLIQ